jgi:NADH-quinone oxidoreductase subunit J
MNITDALFYFFAALLCTAALQTILLKNPVHACLSLILAFLSTAILWMLIKAEFLSLVLVLIYVGAVMVLFLFVIMMLSKETIQGFRQNFYTYLPMAVLMGGILLAQLLYIFTKEHNAKNMVEITQYASAFALGKLLFTEYLLPFEIVGAILLLAIVIAVVLNLRERKDHKSMSVSSQIHSSKNHIVLVDSKKPADQISAQASQQN